MAYKREEITDVSPLGLKKLNDNIRNLWSKVFGDINIGDMGNDVKTELYSNWIQVQGEGNLDSSHPLTIRFYVPENTTKVRKGQLNLIASHYRMDSDVAQSNSEPINLNSVTVTGQVTTSSTGAYTNAHATWGGTSVVTTKRAAKSDNTGAIISTLSALAEYDPDTLSGLYPNGYVDMINHVHNMRTSDLEHTHDISHSHTLSTSGTLPMHTHPLNKGIVEDAENLPSFSVNLNGNDLAVTLNNSTLAANNVDVMSKIAIGSWNTLTVSCAANGDGSKTIGRITVYGIVEVLQKY